MKTFFPNIEQRKCLIRSIFCELYPFEKFNIQKERTLVCCAHDEMTAGFKTPRGPFKMTQSIEKIPGIGSSTAKLLKASGFKTVESIAKATPEALSTVRGFGPIRALRVIEAATALVGTGTKLKKAAKPGKAAKPKKVDKKVKKKAKTKAKKDKKDKKSAKKKTKDKKSGKKTGKKKKK